MKPQDRAETSAAAMLADDTASRALGITLEHVAPGFAAMTMRVEDWHLNGHGICHGGVIFTLADTAFAVACNSYNRRVVAQHNMITYIAPVESGATLRAEAVEVSRTGRSGLYDVGVWDGQTKVAEFRGASRELDGRHFREGEG
ncbi:MAG: hydroxyphenylacetyl-CoA thioesterase PaaI [Dinoroseobacter sp.]|nr:hydroxyphenylacetyl-CoA thioesterase PaaI [Dinoroseobacter sp.]MDJ0995252.1 hydroxyphenylacetyl-CoA thioesterase PaaI [Dinoroseobacter sp.]